MYKYLTALLLVVAVVNSSYFISPAYPPTSFENHYYETRFRVRGMDYPEFQFEGLPEFFKGSKDGIVSGIPTKAGSYLVLIKFSSGNDQGNKQVMLRVTESAKSSNSFVSSLIANAQDLQIHTPHNLIIVAGQQVQLDFTASYGALPYVWVYSNLPGKLRGDKFGKISGQCETSGYYSFSVSVADSNGKSAQSYMTLNVQPRTTVRTQKVVEVPNGVSLQFDLDSIEEEQVEADNEIFNALEGVDSAKDIVKKTKQHFALTTFQYNEAKIQASNCEAAVGQAKKDKDFAQSRLRLAELALNAAQENLNLALSEQTNAAARLAEARAIVDEATKRFNIAKQEYQDAQDALNKAQQQMALCKANLRSAHTERDAAQSQYDLAFKVLESAKSDLEAALRRKGIADQNVADAKDALDIVSQARDDAQAALNAADFELRRAEADLAQALAKLEMIRAKHNQAKIELGAAQWDFENALAELYRAQARKEAADRASAIALAEGSYSNHNVNNGYKTIGQSGYTFAGCSSNNYPQITGTSTVTEVMSQGYKLSSGHKIIYGDCTQKTVCNVGDSINYSGFIVNGIVNANRIARVLLN